MKLEELYSLKNAYKLDMPVSCEIKDESVKSFLPQFNFNFIVNNELNQPAIETLWTQYNMSMDNLAKNLNDNKKFKNIDEVLESVKGGSCKNTPYEFTGNQIFWSKPSIKLLYESGDFSRFEGTGPTDTPAQLIYSSFIKSSLKKNNFIHELDVARRKGCREFTIP